MSSHIRYCEYCNNPYAARRAWQKYCSQHCRQMSCYRRIAEYEQLTGRGPRQAPQGPTPFQEAEWKKRREMAIQERLSDDTTEVNPELIRQAEQILNKSPSSALQDWLDSQPELGPQPQPNSEEKKD